ncbi:transglycosylase domain-containing protein [Curvibacter sp. CHRR-16]|uniref:biosynthetic peptidoglycan transglycosylase n=1 Tax=Curvibacter sp. CHRR-16 TaxID=2835872 RepID=UPI001BDB2A1E|nr:biosynthetic peptidoglycan transglycosylase [Curvibacter sp. CHRR-16]MBT0570484.1 transglycosylase domain-containing protein [Curvibacter sp. CHRR-16]
MYLPKHRVTRSLLLLGVVLMLGLGGLLLGARALLRPAAGDWATTLHLGPVRMEVGVAALVRWGTAPWVARQLHGRSVPTRLGPVRMAWDEASQQLSLQCQPCTLRSSSWGGQPLRLDSVVMTVQRHAHVLHGTVRSGAVRAAWHGNLQASGLELHIDVPETPLADGYALFASVIPEVARVRIGGTFALQATLQLPSKVLRLQPRINAMVVRGLGTEAWGQARSQCSRALPAPFARADLSTSSVLARAVLAAEDQRFYEHPGYDLVEMAKALQRNQDSGATAPRGASTLSQQVAKLLVTGGERSPVRKLRELLYAVEMEQTMGKARILQLYLSHAPWGAGVCGAQAAAHAYFGLRVDQISPAQAVWLAAMLHNPTLEAQRWHQSGRINLERAQWVASAVRGFSPRKRAQLFEALPQLFLDLQQNTLRPVGAE